ncbi:hypothetical protein QAD02_020603 [Eretmocerus hayati]|uniref:Uncharacterized protein n=1 Tax=Eretmocerus hayati TaxID=131215 RepID=A0ACC2PSQ1_9HYME|nr:hypothetical protein QAD02_020603 [Eretmocerus hayati]
MNNQLYFKGEVVESLSLREAILAFYEFLSSFKKKCILTAHNCSYDSAVLIDAMNKVYLKEHYASVVAGFSDTLPITRKKTGKRAAGENKLENLAKKLKISNENAHDALSDVIMLQEVVNKLEISQIDIREHTVTWLDMDNRKNLEKKLPCGLKNLQPLESCVSLNMKKKMVFADITHDSILEVYKAQGITGLKNLLGKDENGRVRVTKCTRVIGELFKHLQATFRG